VKKLCCILLALSMISIFQNCEQGLVTTGEQDVEIIKNMTFALTSKTYTSTTLTAIGTITNNGTGTAYPDWYVEGDFYADSTFKVKLGGDNYKMAFTLAPGETASWQLKFSSDLYTESDYPHFGIKNLRAFKYKED